MTIDLRDNQDRSRYELSIDGRVVSVADYVVRGDSMIFPHTYTEPAHRGQGLAERVVQMALDDARRAGRTVVPQCWFVAEFIDDHPEYRDLVAA